MKSRSTRWRTSFQSLPPAGASRRNASWPCPRTSASMRLASAWPATSASTPATTVHARGNRARTRFEQLHLRRAGLSGGAEVARPASLLRMELVMAERVDGALGDDERAIVRPGRTLPGRLAPPGREAGEAVVFDLEARDDVRVVRVHKQHVLARPEAPGFGESAVAQRLGPDAPRVEVGTVVGAQAFSKRLPHADGARLAGPPRARAPAADRRAGGAFRGSGEAPRAPRAGRARRGPGQSR